jgi:acetyltransferase-like isoleucine patch superfamily enzyme/acyl carrier protein
MTVSLSFGWIEDARTRYWLRGCRIGRSPKLVGHPLIVAAGTIEIGDDFELRSVPIRSHLVAQPGSVLRIGNRVRIGAGAAVSCDVRVDIGDGVSVGSFGMIMDSDFHVAGNLGAIAEPRPVYIGAGARLGHRVIVLAGARIGEGATVHSNSVISGDVRPFAVVAGNPARPVSDGAASDADSGDISSGLLALIQSVLALDALPSIDDGPERIEAWDSLGSLRLIVAVEEHFNITLTEDELKSTRSIADLAKRIEAARARER